MKAGRLLDRAVKKLEASEAIDHWQKHRELYEAEDLLIHAMGGELPHRGDEILGGVRRRFEAMVKRRAAGEPSPYIKGSSEFRGLDILARPGVFVPPDSS